MVLQIADGENKEFSTDCFRLKPHMLSLGATHMFIASNAWDRIELCVSDDMKPDMLKYLNTVTDDLRVALPDNITSDTLITLTALYPDKAGKLRKAFMCGEDIKEVLKDCLIVS